MSTAASTSYAKQATLYSFPGSVWSRAARFAGYDLGCIPDLIYVRDVNLDIGEQYRLDYLRLNPNGTVPTLVIPAGSALSIDGAWETILRDSKSIIDLLTTHARSRGALPKLDEQQSTRSAEILALLRDPQAADPRGLARSPRDEHEFRMMAPKLGVVHIYRQDVLENTLLELEPVSVGSDGTVHPGADEDILEFVRGKSVFNQRMIRQWTEQDLESKVLIELFERSKALWGTRLPDTLSKLEQLIVGPYCVGEELCPADYTMGSWLERVVHAAEGGLDTDGLRAVEKKVGAGFAVGPKVRAWWALMLGRPSFQKTFAAVEDRWEEDDPMGTSLSFRV